ncbi:MAG: hypothetical protein JWN98_2476, partial [Abditibacteriota bacterium]|nr:hypothetical protein [Abditibacteriota bacterium]
KTCFVATKSMDRVPIKNPGFERRLGHTLELVPDSNPVTPMGPDTPMAIRLWFRGKPLAKTKVSFIPRGTALKPGFDARYDRTTNANGRVTFTPQEGNYYLIVAHHETSEKGSGYDSTKYAAALTVYVPQICPCCG